MIQNETMKSILARRSYKMFDGRPIGDEELKTILMAGLYAPTGMNAQPWHFTVIRSREMLDRIAEGRKKIPMPPPPPGAPAFNPAAMGDPMRNAPVLIIVSGRNTGTAAQDCVLAMENMFIAAASLGIMSGWDHMMVKDFFADGVNDDLKAELIPEGNTVYAAAFFGYVDTEPRDRGERKGTIAYF